MKKQILFSLFLFSLFCFKATAQPAICQQMCIGHKQSENILDVIVLPNGHFLFTMPVEDSVPLFNDKPYKYCAVIVEMDTNLNIITKKYFGGSNGGSGFFDLYQDEHKNIFCYGSSTATNGDAIGGGHGSSDLFIVKLDSNYNKIWSHCYGGTGLDKPASILASPDGGAVFSSGSNTSGGDIPLHYGSSFTHDAIMYKVDSLGNLQWVKVIGGSADDGPNYGILPIDSTHFTLDVGGFSNDYDFAGTFGNSSDTLKLMKMIFDYSGNITKKKTFRYQTYYYMGEGLGNNLAQQKRINNKLYMLGTGTAINPYCTPNLKHSGDEGLLAIYDTALNVIKMHQFGGMGTDAFRSFTIDKDSNFYFAGVTSSTNGDLYSTLHSKYDFWLLKTDKYFVPQWSRTFGGTDYISENSNILSKIFVINNKLYFWSYCAVPATLPDGDLTCGHYGGPPPLSTTSDAWIVVFDLNTKVGIELLADTITSTTFKIYPNPATEVLQIEPLANSTTKQKVILYDMQGKAKLKTNLQETGITSIAVNQLPTGTYTLSILQKNKILFTQKIIINQ